MNEQPYGRARRVSRDELFALVWQRPMIRLAAEFGITGNGLAKICDRLNVPYPSSGYWAKKHAGKPVPNKRLPPAADGALEWVDIRPTSPKPKPLPEAKAASESASTLALSVTVPETLDNLHPKVEAWISQHQQEQRRRVQERKKQKRDFWGSPEPLLDDLTARDLYRFRVTSAIFEAVEKAGGNVEDAPISGRVKFKVTGHIVECSIVEKMFRPLVRPEGDAARWTAYPEHQQGGLHSSGFLRVTITTYLNGKQHQWVETRTDKIDAWLPEIVGAIIGAAPILAEAEREREESARRYREAEARRYEQERLKAIDDERWSRFRARAADWEECERLRAFLAELELRYDAEGDTQAGDQPLSVWIAWVQKKIDTLDPLRNSVCDFFVAVDR